MKINLIIPTDAWRGKKSFPQAHYLLRRHGIDLTDLLIAALSLWEEKVEKEGLERNQDILDFFKEFLDEEKHFDVAQRTAVIINKALADIQSQLAEVIEPYLETLFKGLPIKLKLKDILGGDIVIEIGSDENLHERVSRLENHSANRGDC